MPFTALLYKEFRQQVSIWITLFACTVLMQVFTTLTFSLQPNPPENWTRIMVLFNLSWVIVTVYAFGSACSIFVAEHEEKTYSFLRGLPIRRGTLLAAKLAWVLLGTFSLALCLAVETCVFLLLTTFPSPSDFRQGVENFSTIDGCYSVAITFCNTIFAAIVWGLFWSARSRHQLFALLATFVCAAATGTLCKYFFFDTDYELAVLLGVECIVLAFALYRAYFWFDRWVDRRSSPSKSRGHSAAQSQKSRGRSVAQSPDAPVASSVDCAEYRSVPGSFLCMRFSFVALTWHAVRQSGWLFAFAIAVGIVCIASRYFMKQLGDDIMNVIGGIALFAICVFCGSIFTADHRHNTIAMLGHRGVRPGKIWWSRITAFGTVYFLLFIAYCTAFSHQHGIESFLMAILVMPFCCGALISLLFRSPILAPCLTAAMWAFCLFWTVIFLTVAGVYTRDSHTITIWWPAFPLLIGFLIASRLRIDDWLRERSVWRSRRPVVCLIVGPALLLLAAIPFIRIYSVPVVNYGYFIDMADVNRRTITNEMAMAYSDVWRPINSRDDLRKAAEALRILQKANVEYVHGVRGTINAFLDNLEATIQYKRQERPQRKHFVTIEFIDEAIALLESLEKNHTPLVDRVRIAYEHDFRTILDYLNHPDWIHDDNIRYVFRCFRWMPWERIRAMRQLENDFQIQSRYAERTERAVFGNKGDMESLILSYSDDYLRGRREPWTGLDSKLSGFEGVAPPGAVFNEEIKRRLLVLRFALLKFGLEKNRLPETLDELVTEGILKELPTQPNSGDAFGYDKSCLYYQGHFPPTARIPAEPTVLRKNLFPPCSVEVEAFPQR